jgi:hypothetical protein
MFVHSDKFLLVRASEQVQRALITAARPSQKCKALHQTKKTKIKRK